MTMQALFGATIVTPQGARDAEALLVEGGRIAGIVPLADIPGDAERHVLDGGYLLPGFIDVQVNGGGGVLFNDRPDVEGVRAIADAHRRFGTTALLPTLISDTLDKDEQAITAFVQAND